MRKLELKDIVCYLPHGLKVFYEKCQIAEIDVVSFMSGGVQLCERGDWRKYGILSESKKKDNRCKIILRPLSDLYRTITHNGKEIVPIWECAKIALPNFEFTHADELCYCEDKRRGLIQFYMEHGTFTVNFVDDLGYVMVNQISLFDYLNELKIDYRGLIDACLAIDVNTLDINPYK